jgi:FkbM family methyltransferase
MANTAWKRIETSPKYQRAKLALKRLVGQELSLKPEMRVACVTDGGWIYDATKLDENSVVYSFGICDNIEFDLALIMRTHAKVHAFDPTPAAVSRCDDDTLPSEFQFHAWAVAGQDGPLTLYPRVGKSGEQSEVMYTLVADQSVRGNGLDVPAYTIPTILAKLGHSKINLLKMDIEGAEYDALDEMLRSPLRPEQLLVEFHHRFSDIGPDRTRRLIDRLKNAGYRIFAVSDIGREVSFLHKAQS